MLSIFVRCGCSQVLCFVVDAHEFWHVWNMPSNNYMWYKFSYGWLIWIVVHPPPSPFTFSTHTCVWATFGNGFCSHTQYIMAECRQFNVYLAICSISMLLMWCVSARFQNVRFYSTYLCDLRDSMGQKMPFPIQHSCKNTAAINCKSTNNRRKWWASSNFGSSANKPNNYEAELFGLSAKPKHQKRNQTLNLNLIHIWLWHNTAQTHSH